jgi:2-iminobutanoate/2-iminopropanoate deaminase
MSERTVIQTDTAPAAVGPYSQAVRAGGLLFTAGQIPLLPDGTMVEGDVETQARQVLANLRAVLEAGGSDPSRVVKCTVFLRDMNDFGRVNEVYGEVFADAPPARSAIQVARLPFDAAVEIEAIALVDEGA